MFYAVVEETGDVRVRRLFVWSHRIKAGEERVPQVGQKGVRGVQSLYIHCRSNQSSFKNIYILNSKVELSEVAVDVIYDVFDADRDGTLTTSEFFDVLRKRKHTGFETGPMSRLFKCTVDCVKSSSFMS